MFQGNDPSEDDFEKAQLLRDLLRMDAELPEVEWAKPRRMARRIGRRTRSR